MSEQGGPGQRQPADDPLWWSVSRLAEAYRSRALSPTEVVDRALARLDEVDPLCRVTLARRDDRARREAREAERAYRSDRPPPLAGIPISVKDLSHVAGSVTTYGSLTHERTPQVSDSGAVRRLRGGGAIVVAKTNASEFGQSATTENRLGPPCVNPWDLGCTAGGSSGGAAVSVAAGVVPVALGSDGGGSIRIPAAFNGVVGFKPTQGRCQDEGGTAGFDGLATVGPLARNVADAALAFGVLADAAMAPEPLGARPRIGVVESCDGRPVDPRVRTELHRVADVLEAAGMSVRPLELDVTGWREIFNAVVLDGERGERLHLLARREELSEPYRRVLEAAVRLSDDAARRCRRAWPGWRQEVDRQLAHVDAVLMPPTAVPAFPVGRRPLTVDGHPVGYTWGAFWPAPLANVADLPAISLPSGWCDGLPLGVQLVGRHGQDESLLLLAAWVEALLGFGDWVPPLSSREGVDRVAVSSTP